MVYIEFFDKNIIENIYSCLASPPNVVYIIGESKVVKKQTEIYEKIFSARNHNITFIPRGMGKSSLSETVDKLTDIILPLLCQGEEVSIDLTGGDEMYLVATGIVFERLKEKNLQLHRYDMSKNVIKDCDGDKHTITCLEPPKLSIHENVLAYGGDIIFESPLKPDGTHIWNMDEDFRQDIIKMWDICGDISANQWNIQTGILESVNKNNAGDSVTVNVHKNEYISKLISLLEENELAEYGENGLVCKNAQIKKCLTKSGQLLELLVYLFALEAKDSSGIPIYNDVLTGVCLDWDGVLPSLSNEANTYNEIDVMMMRGIIPVFVSCKNGRVSSDEIFKFSRVAERFGGKYAKAYLIASVLENDAQIKSRAKDMNVTVINLSSLCVDKKTGKTDIAEIKRKVANLWR